MSDTEVDYLQPDFDPASITVPRLRSLLVRHNVQYPATAKKAQLVEIFNENVVPQAKRILDRRAKAKRSSMGITNVDNSVGYSVASTEDMRPPPSASRSRGRPKKNPASAASSFTAPSEEPEQTPQPRNTSPRKRQVRSTSRQLGYSDTDTDSQYDTRRSTRKTSRRLDLTPQQEVKVEDESETDTFLAKQTPHPDTVFSTENPFQSGSSPLASETPTNRRRTAHIVESSTQRPTSTRRRTETPNEPEQHQAYSRSVEVPQNRFVRPKTPQTPQTPKPVFETPVVEASEEFTPEEQLALAQEDAPRAQNAVVPRRNKGSSGFATPFWVLLITAFGAYAAWFRQEKVAVGYCGVGKPTQEIIPRHLSFQDYDFDVPEWVIQLAEPQCEPCPPHAYCYADHSVRCEEDFILKSHPLSAGGLIPLPPTCEPDGEKVRRVKAVADKAVEELRERRAKFECGELVGEDGKQPDTPAIAVEELKEAVSEQRSKKLSKKEFDDLWVSALGEIETRDEIEAASNEVVEEAKP